MVGKIRIFRSGGYDPTLGICARCHKPLDEKRNWSDGMACENCDKKICDPCARETLGGDDSSPSLYCPGCLSCVSD